jgi:hypothetical protein
LLGLVAGVAVLAPVLGRGYALSYDMVFVPRPPITAAVLGTDGSVPRAVPTDLVVALLARVLPGEQLQQALLLLIFLLAGWGVARLLPGPVAGLAGALAYAWNPYVGERLVLGHWAFLVGYAVLPWVAGAALAVRRGTAGLPPLLLWLGAAALAGSTAALLATGVALAVLGLRPAPARAAWVLAFAVAVNAPWWLPALARPGGVPADPAGVPAFAARADSPLGVLGSLGTLGGIWNPAVWPAERQHLLLVLAALAGVLAALACGLRPLLAGPLLARPPDRAPVAGAGRPERAGPPAAAIAAGQAARTGSVGTDAGRADQMPDGMVPGVRGLLAAGAAGFAVAAAGGLAWSRPLITAVVVHVPGGGLLRDGQKLLAPAALVVALAAGQAVARLAAARRTLPYAVLLGVLPVLVLPSLAAGASGRLTGVRYPASWLQLRAAVSAAPPGDVAVLPWALYRRFDWNGDRVLLDPLPRLLPRQVVVNDDLPLSTVTVRGENQRADAITAGLARGADPAGLLRTAGIRYAVVHRTQPGAGAVEAALTGLPVLFRSDDLLLVEIPGPLRPPPRPRPLLAAGLGLAGLALAGAAGVGLSSARRRRLLRSPALRSTDRSL